MVPRGCGAVVAADRAAQADLRPCRGHVERYATKRMVAIHISEIEAAVSELIDHFGCGASQHMPHGLKAVRRCEGAAIAFFRISDQTRLTACSSRAVADTRQSANRP
jgi:hypothetical protein